MSRLSDEELIQATCAVLINNKVRGTAWLVSDEGHLVTAGHVLCEELEGEVYEIVEIRFDEEEPYQSKIIAWEFENREVDFAVL